MRPQENNSIVLEYIRRRPAAFAAMITALNLLAMIVAFTTMRGSGGGPITPGPAPATLEPRPTLRRVVEELSKADAEFAAKHYVEAESLYNTALRHAIVLERTEEKLHGPTRDADLLRLQAVLQIRIDLAHLAQYRPPG